MSNNSKENATVVKLIRVDHYARVYETVDKRFHAAWQAKQGARSCYRVLDRKTARCLRAFTLARGPRDHPGHDHDRSST